MCHVNLPSDDFLIGLSQSVQSGLAQRGFHFLSRDELDELSGPEASRAQRLQRLRLFAGTCGAELETNEDVTVARFVPVKESESLSLGLAPRSKSEAA